MALSKLSLGIGQDTALTDSITANTQSKPFYIGTSPAALIYMSGTYAAVNVTFEQSFDSTNGSDGNWISLMATTLTGSAANTTNTGSQTNAFLAYYASQTLAPWIRIRSTAWTSGAMALKVVPLSTPLPTQTVFLNGGTVTANVGTGGTAATSLGKAEDAAHATGDTGVAMWGVRAPATPTTPTSTAGDYGYIQLDTEGKVVVAGTADSALQVQSRTDLTTTSDVALLASAGSGVRNYVTDVIVENTGASAARFFLRDGTTHMMSVTVPAGNTYIANLQTPLRGTAATAVNGLLGAAGTVTVTLIGYKGV